MSYSLAFSQALLVMLAIAAKVESGRVEFFPTTRIAHDLNIPPSTVAMILRRLSHAGLIEMREGIKGGARLAIPSDRVTLFDIFAAIEQKRPMFPINTQWRIDGELPSKAQRVAAQRLKDAEDAMKDNLRMTTVRDLMHRVLNETD